MSTRRPTIHAAVCVMTVVAGSAFLAACTAGDSMTVDLEEPVPAEAPEGEDIAGDDVQEHDEEVSEAPADNGDGRARDSGDSVEDHGKQIDIEADPEDVESLAAKASDATFVATYDTRIFWAPIGEIASLLTIAQDPPRMMAMSQVTELDGWTSLYLMPGDGSLIDCETSQNREAWECDRRAVDLEDEQQDWIHAMELSFPFAEAVASLADASKGSPATIANRSARCFSSSFGQPESAGTIDSDAFELCLDEQTGILLRFTSNDVVTAKATEVGDPEPHLFVPPAEPSDIDDLYSDSTRP